MNITEIGQWLMDNYYSKYVGDRTDIVPTMEQIYTGLKAHEDKIVVVQDDKIRGVGIFVTLTDETFNMLRSFDITEMDVLAGLFQQHGPNLHFVILCADGYRTIMTGLRQAKERVNPKTISWWNPDLTHLHKYTLRS